MQGTRSIIEIRIGMSILSENNKSEDNLIIIYDGIQWNFNGKLFPRDIYFLNKLVELVKEHKTR